ncbi:uncharacterized protein MELLADRAFT_71221, partial [Melampsora larici-populina 98AG31]
MSINTIMEATATLGAMTPSNNAAISPEGRTNGNQNNEERSSGSQLSSTTSSGAFGKYNKQMLISNYLNRGKETNPKDKSVDKSKDKSNAGGTQSAEILERNKKDAVSNKDVSIGYKQIPSTTASKDPADARKEANLASMEAEFCAMFGTSTKLPQIQKKQSDGPSGESSAPLDDTSFAEAVKLLNKIKANRQATK